MHAQAVEMSDIILAKQGIPAGVSTLATKIKAAQGTDAARLFLEQMIGHHEAAIDMAQQEIRTGKYPATIQLCRDIVTSQAAEIVEMKALLGTL